MSDQRVVGRVFVTQVKYKESGKKERSSSLYSTMADTLETSFAREVTGMQSEVNVSSYLFNCSAQNMPVKQYT